MNSLKIILASVNPFVNNYSKKKLIKNTLSISQETPVMRVRNFKLLLVLILGFVFFSCASEDDEIYTNNFEILEDDSFSYTAIEHEILMLVNKHRDSLGLSTLSLVNFVSGVADGHTDYMIQNGQISHDNFAQRSQTIMNNANAKSVGENVAYGFTTAQGVVNGWLKSDGHRKIIESKKYTHCGISTNCNTTGRNFFTQIFIQR